LYKDLLVLIATIIILVEIYRKLRQIWLQHQLMQKIRRINNGENRRCCDRKVSAAACRNCRNCQEDKGKRQEAQRDTPVSWQLGIGKGRLKKKVNTAG